MRKEILRYDLWAKEISPSLALREWCHADIKGHWEKFESRYVDELNGSMYVHEFLEQIEQHQTVTLLYAAHDPVHNHAVVLRGYIQSRLAADHLSSSPSEL